MNSDNDLPRPDVPRAVVSRLSLYLRELQQLSRIGKETINSNQLGKRLGITDAQVRKDLAYFGQFGYPGKGYRCDELIEKIRQILGTDRIWPVVLVGCGNLGQALLGYQGFERVGFQVVAAFDNNPNIIGEEFSGLKVKAFSELTSFVSQESIRMAILAVPPGSAKFVVEHLVRGGISGILNFAPVTLSVPKRISVIDVDLAMELEQLVFAAFKKSAEK